MKNKEIDPLIVVNRNVLNSLPDNIKSLFASAAICEGSELFSIGVNAASEEAYYEFLEDRGLKLSLV